MNSPQSNLKNHKKCRFPIFFDLVQDKVVNRVIYVILVIMLFLIFASSLLRLIDTQDSHVSQIEFGISPPQITDYNLSFNQTRIARAFVKNKHGTLIKGAKGKIVLKYINVPVQTDRPLCNTNLFSQLQGTIQIVRLANVCQPIFTGNKSQSNENGVLQFSSFTINSGPQGQYMFVYSSEGVQSQYFDVSVKSDIEKLTVLTKYPSQHTIGENFTQQPVVLVSDQNGSPLSGVRVVAFSWIDSYFQNQQQDSVFLYGNKFVILSGSVSEPSDSNGHAKFTNLKIQGANYQYANILFSAQGRYVVNWSVQAFSALSNSVPLPPTFGSPIHLFTNVKTVQIITNPSLTVKQGQVWPIQPKIKVVDQSGNPISGKIVIAYAIGRTQKENPLRLQNLQINQSVKQLINTIPGEFKNINNYLNGDSIISIVKTDAFGEVQFSSIKWNTKGVAGQGPVGQYKLAFVCDGVFSQIITQQVQSSLSDAIFVGQQPLTQLNMNINAEFNHLFTIRAINAELTGIEGKFIQQLVVQVLDGSSSDVAIRLENSISEYSVSNQDGFMQMPIKILMMKNIQQTIKLTFKMDGSSFTLPNNIVIKRLDSTSAKFCTFIETITGPPATISNGETFNMSIKGLTQTGLPWTGGQVNFKIVFNSIYPNKMDVQRISSFQTAPSSQTTDATTGIANLNSFKFINQPQGSYFMNFEGTNSLQENCKSQTFLFTITSQIQSIQLVSPVNVNFALYDQNINMGQEITSIIKILGNDLSPLANTNIGIISLVPVHIPYSLFSQMYNGTPNFITLLTTTGTTDSNGEINVKWKLNNGNTGSWGIVFRIQGHTTLPPFTFTTDFPVAKVNILTQPATSGTVYIGDYATTSPQIQVLDSSNSHLQNYMVTSFIFSVDSSTGNLDTSSTRNEGILDPYTSTFQNLIDSINNQTSLTAMSHQFVTLYNNKNGRTDASGTVTLPKFTILDHNADKSACFKFVFVVGQARVGRFVMSALSDMLCFSQDQQLIVTNNPSIKVSPNQKYISPPSIRLTKNKVSDQDQNGLFMLIVSVNELNNQSLVKNNNSFEDSQNYFQGNVCAFYAQKNIFGGCSDLVVQSNGSGSTQYIVETTFTQLRFTNYQQITFSARISTPLQGLQHFAQLRSTKVITSAQVLTITTQPPNQVLTFYPFTLQVFGSLDNGSPVSNLYIAANITQSTTISSIKNITSTIFQYAATGKISLPNLADLSSPSNIRLDQETSFAMTNTYGIATFNIVVISGLNGEYKLRFSADGIQSELSNKISVTNVVKSVTNKINLSQSNVGVAERDDEQNKQWYTITLNPQPIVQIYNIQNTLQSGLSNHITVNIISEKDLQQALNNLGIKQSSGVTYNKLVQNIKESKNQYEQAISAINNAWKIFTKGASDVGKVQRKSSSQFVTYSNPTQNSSKQYVFSDLKIYVQNPGTYRILFSCLGIQSQFSDKVIIEDPLAQYSTTIFIVVIFTGIFFCFILFFTLASNSYFHKGTKLNIVFSIITLVTNLVLIGLALVINVTLVVRVFLLILLCLLFIMLIIQIVISRVGKFKHFIFYRERERVYREYTYQRLFLEPSREWKELKRSPQISEELINQNGEQANQQQDRCQNNQIHVQEKYFNDQLQEPKIQQKKEQELNQKPSQQQNKLLDQIKPDSNCSQNKSNFRYRKRTFQSLEQSKKNQSIHKTLPFYQRNCFKNMLQIFVPFQFIVNTPKVGDCFFYPQRVLISLYLALLAFFFLFYNLIVFQLGIESKIIELKRNAIITIYKFVNLGVQYLHSWLGLVALNDTISPFLQDIQQINEFLNGLSRAIVIGISIASTISSLIIILGFFFLLYNYKKRVLEARFGIWPYPRRRFNIINAYQLPGSLISTYSLGYILITIMFSIIFVPLSYLLLWKIVWAYRHTLFVVILLPTLIHQILKIIAKKCLAKGQIIKCRRLFVFFEIILLYSGITIAFFNGAFRFILMLIVGLISLGKIDVPIVPLWVLQRVMWLDFPNGSYNATILMQHTHNNPIVITFMQILCKLIVNLCLNLLVTLLESDQGKIENIELVDQQEVRKQKTLRRISRRIRVCLLLNKNIELIPYRKHNLIIKKKQKEGKQKYNQAKNIVEEEEPDKFLHLEKEDSIKLKNQIDDN